MSQSTIDCTSTALPSGVDDWMLVSICHSISTSPQSFHYASPFLADSNKLRFKIAWANDSLYNTPLALRLVASISWWKIGQDLTCYRNLHSSERKHFMKGQHIQQHWQWRDAHHLGCPSADNIPHGVWNNLLLSWASNSQTHSLDDACHSQLVSRFKGWRDSLW